MRMTVHSGIHPSHFRSVRRVFWALAALVAVFLAGIKITLVAPVMEAGNFLSLHTVLESSAVVISLLIFVIGWNVHDRGLYQHHLVMAVLFLAVGIFDFSHALSYKGMPDFVTPSGVEKGIAFWLFARLFAATGLLLASLQGARHFAMRWNRLVLLVAVLVVTAGAHWIVFFHSEILPRTFVQGEGLTKFKLNAEYLIIAINLVAAIILLHRMQGPLNFNAGALLGAAFIMALSETCFTLYLSTSDVFNVLGHFFKVAAYYLLYRAIFVETVDFPYIKLRDSQEQLRATLDAVPDLLFEVDLDGRYLDYHTSRDDLLAAPAEVFIGKTVREVVPSDAANICMAAIEEANRTGRSQGHQYSLKIGDNVYWFELSVAGKHIGDGLKPHFIVLCRDISERKAHEMHIRKMAQFDTLTQLPNRAYLVDRVTQTLSFVQRNRQSMAVMFVDIDHFKKINDTLGHQAGDELLIKLAQQFKSVIRDEDTVARLGGDEFVFVFPGLNEKQAAQVAQKLLGVVEASYALAHLEVLITISVGIALYPADGEDFDVLTRKADAAMYRAKQKGRNTFCFFTAEMQENSLRVLQLNNALRHALQRNQLTVHYQPQVTTAGTRIIGVEALVRWQHPEWGMISPAEFIPVAEEGGLISALGEWVLETAIAQMRQWLDNGLPPLIMAVNISAVQLRNAELPALIDRMLKTFDIAPAFLELELTESVAMHDPQAAMKLMSELQDTGVRIAIDDFGTGYSSLSYLKKFRISKLKIDKSFVRDIDIDHEDRAIISAIIRMASSLGLKTIAEGVETTGQLEFLRHQGCDEMQGYLFSPAVSAERFEVLYRGNTPLWKASNVSAQTGGQPC